MNAADRQEIIERETENFRKGVEFGAANSNVDFRQMVEAMMKGIPGGPAKATRADALNAIKFLREFADAIEETLKTTVDE